MEEKEREEEKERGGGGGDIQGFHFLKIVRERRWKVCELF